MKKLLYGAAAMAFTSVALAKTNVSYPTEKVAEFIVDKLDVTTFPSVIRRNTKRQRRHSVIMAL